MTNEQKLTDIETKLKKWQTRMTRAHNAIVKLNRQRKRITNPKLMRDYDAYIAKGKAETLAKGIEKELKAGFDKVKAAPVSDVSDISWAEMTCAEPTRPAFLDRTDPLIAERMTAARKKAEAAERSKMPLSGRDAMKAIRAKKGG